MAKTNDLIELTDMFIMDKEYKGNLVYVRDIDAMLVYQREKHYYKVYNKDEFEQVTYPFLRTRAKNLTQTMIREFFFHVKMSVNRKIENISFDYVAFNDKFLNLNTFEFEEFNDEKMATHFLPFNSEDINMPTPIFNRFVDDVIVDSEMKPDTKLQMVLQEMFGFYFYNEFKPHIVFFLVGGGANGKSVILKILSEIIGKDFINNKSIQTLTTKEFATSSFAGKKINICNEEESKYLRGDRFKAFISGDPVEGEHKFGGYYNFLPSTKFIFAMNDWPSFDGINFGLKRRLKIFPFLRKLAEHEQDKDLFEKMRCEIPGIIRFAIEGAKRLRAQKHIFSDSEAIDRSMIDFENSISGAIMFIRENFIEDSGHFVSNNELYAEYVEWSSANGRKALNSANFLKDISNILKLPSELQWIAEKKKTLRGRLLKRIDDNPPSNPPI